MKKEVFSDRIDVDVKTSLYDYGFIRNPLTGKTVICFNTYKYMYDGSNPEVRVQYIDFDEVYGLLEEVSDYFYDYIGELKEQVLRELHNDNLTPLIYALNDYNGCYDRF